MDRLAIMPFENLTGDASADWAGPAAAAILIEELAGSTKVVISRATNPGEAYQAKASRFLHATYTRSASAQDPPFRMAYQVEDAVSHKLTDPVTIAGDPLSAAHAIAIRIDNAAKPFSTADAKAVEAWGHADFERAVQLDPGFGTAWGLWVQKLAAEGKAAEAVQNAERALQQTGLRSDVQRAQIQLLLAGWRQDQGGRRAALDVLARATPNDPVVLSEIAAIEISARRFSEAAAQFRRVLELKPGDSAILNSLGYAEAYGGNVEAARQTLEQYGKQPGQEINALDSLGEAHFVNGRFQEAAGYFHQVQRRDPSFLGGTALLKAAYAEWLSGNLATADATLTPFFSSLVERRDPAAAWREASWLYATGRRALAIEKLEASPSPLAAQQLAVWKGQNGPPLDIAVLAGRYRNSSPFNDGMYRAFYATALVAAGRGEEARPLLRHWPLPLEGEPLFQALVFQQFLETRKKLGIH